MITIVEKDINKSIGYWNKIKQLGNHLDKEIATGVHRTPADSGGFINSIQDKKEMCSFLEVIEDHGVNTILETGLGNGGTHMLFKQIGTLVLSIEQSFLASVMFENILKNLDILQGSKIINGLAHYQTSGQEIKKILNGSFLDCVYIDTFGPGKQIKTQWEIYQNLVKVGGIICVHNYAKYKEFLNDEVDHFLINSSSECNPINYNGTVFWYNS